MIYGISTRPSSCARLSQTGRLGRPVVRDSRKLDDPAVQLCETLANWTTRPSSCARPGWADWLLASPEGRRGDRHGPGCGAMPIPTAAMPISGDGSNQSAHPPAGLIEKNPPMCERRQRGTRQSGTIASQETRPGQVTIWSSHQIMD